MIPLLAAIWLGGLAKKPAEPVVDAPPWTTEDGRTAARMELVTLLLEQGNPNGALELIAQCRDMGAKGPDWDLVQGRALAAAGLSDDAIPLLEGIGRRNKAYADAQDSLGLIWMDRKDLKAATDAFGRAVQADKGSARYLNNLGFAQLSAGDANAAVDSFRAALAIDGSPARTRNNLGFALVAAGKDEEAFRAFRAAGSEADADYNLGAGIELRGDTDAARQWYQRALEADSRHLASRRAMDRLAATSNNSTHHLESP